MYRMAVLKSGLKKLNINTENTLSDHRFVIDVLDFDASVSARYFAERAFDLIVIDLCQEPEKGLRLLRALRAGGICVEVISYVARNDCETLRRVMRLGVVDCLVDPFDTDRFEEAVERFLRRMRLVEGGGTVTQDKIDRLFHVPRATVTLLPKGLQRKTLNRIRAVFNSRPDDSFSCGDIVDTVNLSHITVQRYLSYLHENNELVSNLNYRTGGRPCSLYRYNGRLFA